MLDSRFRRDLVLFTSEVGCKQAAVADMRSGRSQTCGGGGRLRGWWRLTRVQVAFLLHAPYWLDPTSKVELGLLVARTALNAAAFLFTG